MRISKKKTRKMTGEFDVEEELGKEPAEIQTPLQQVTPSKIKYIEKLNIALCLTEILLRFEREEENEKETKLP